MKIRVVPDARNYYPQWIELAKVLTEDDVVDTLTFKVRSTAEMSIEDAGDALLALYAWRSVTGNTLLAESGAMSGMQDMSELATRLGLDLALGGVASICVQLEAEDYILNDIPPSEVTSPGYYAFLNGGGLERGLSVLGRMYEERVYPANSFALSASGPVPLNHNNPEVAQAIELAKCAIEVIRTSNTISADDKETWISHLQAGVSLLSKPKVYLSAISLLICQPLYSAFSSVIEDSAKPVIQAALNAIRALVGL
ncbi:hypothetical protein [Sphingomonas fuzhouensis]|uniref:hypothetical protein n=1 Tax=Sphingomonas fuzhouensis TaxID=3106033 RepID=UPI002AFEE8B5|nr:hypothetical protein [Sphingomonas sp. SGZ-02]